MPLRKGEAVVPPHHQAVVLPDKLADCTDGGLAGKLAELYCGLCVALAGKDAVVDSAEGEHVPWAAEIRGGGARVGKLPARQGSVVGGDPRGRAHGVVARDGEGRAVRFLVVRDHLREVEAVKVRSRHGGDD